MKRFVLLLFVVLVLEPAGRPAMAAGFEANIRWARQVELSTPVNGVIETVTVMQGSFVRKGRIMLTLDSIPFKSELRRARAVRVRAAVSRDEAKRDYDQAKQLYADTVLSTVELQNAEDKYKRATAEWSAADAEVSLAEYRLARSIIRAPFDGWVLRRNAEPGETVASRLAPPILLVFAEAGRYIASAPVPEGQLKLFPVGKQVRVKVGGRSYSGTVWLVGMEKVLPNKNKKESCFPVDVLFRVSGPVLRAGQKAEIELP